MWRGVLVCGPPHGEAWCVTVCRVALRCVALCCVVWCGGGVWPPSWWGVLRRCVAPRLVGRAALVCGPPIVGPRCVVVCGVGVRRVVLCGVVSCVVLVCGHTPPQHTTQHNTTRRTPTQHAPPCRRPNTNAARPTIRGATHHHHTTQRNTVQQTATQCDTTQRTAPHHEGGHTPTRHAPS